MDCLPEWSKLVRCITVTVRIKTLLFALGPVVGYLLFFVGVLHDCQGPGGYGCMLSGCEKCMSVTWKRRLKAASSSWSGEEGGGEGEPSSSAVGV